MDLNTWRAAAHDNLTRLAGSLRRLAPNTLYSALSAAALLPVVTIIGLNFGLLISGAVLTETIFSLAGVGRTLVDGITARDYTLVQGFTVVIAVSFVVINLFTDLIYSYLDPRIRLG